MDKVSINTPGLTIHCVVDLEYQPEVDQARLVAVVEQVLLDRNYHQTELSLSITSDEAVQALNRAYRGFDKPTDVLSFEADMAADNFVLPVDVTPYLGDIIISAQTATKQAQAMGHTPFEEILLLAIHGTLHLLGYDHMTTADKTEMWQKQTDLLEANGLGHVTPTE